MTQPDQNEPTQTAADRARAAYRIQDMVADVTKKPTAMTSQPVNIEPAYEEQEEEA